MIAGRRLSFRELTSTNEDHRTLCRWLWTILLADGTRSLVSAGRWDHALAHAERHGGIGQRLLDGRQVAILTRTLAGDPASALAMLKESATSEPWEQPVAACLTVLCLRTAARPANSAIAAMADRYLDLEPSPELLVFRTRLGLAVIDLAGGTGQPGTVQIAARLVDEAVTAADGYAAQDLLTHDKCRARLTSPQKQAQTATVQSSGLSNSTIPAHLMTDLLAAVETSETATARSLAARDSPRPCATQQPRDEHQYGEDICGPNRA
jgi:hypothetical protein